MQVFFMVVRGHSTTPIDGDATESGNMLSSSTKQRLWEQNVTGHKEKQGRKQVTSPNHEHPLVKNKEKKHF